MWVVNFVFFIWAVELGLSMVWAKNQKKKNAAAKDFSKYEHNEQARDGP